MIPQKLRPITRILATIGELPTSYLISMTYEEQLLWFCNYLENTVIPAINNNADAVAEVQKLLEELKQYVDDYFDNLNLQEEIDKVLDEMIEDGRLAEIINQEVFDELNAKVATLEENVVTINEDIADIEDKFKTLTYNNIFVGTFFDATNESVHFLTSLDGQNWSEFNKDVTINGRDPQLIYNKDNKTFYLSLTQSAGEHYDFICYTSTNFVDWTQHQVDLGLHSGMRWAPELFIDTDGTMYATISRGADFNSFKIYLSECTDIETLTFDSPRELNLGLTNVIDANIVKYNNLYYLTVKNEIDATIHIYTSPDLVTFTEVNSNVLKSSVPCEGGQLLNINGRWYFYGDTWQSYRHYGIMQTNDITDFGFLIANHSLKMVRHGSVLYLDDKEAVNIITTLYDYNNMTNLYMTESQIILEGTYNTLVVYPNTFYRVSGAGATINKLENPFNLQIMPFTFTAGNNATFTVKFKNNKTKTIYNSPVENEKLQFISLQGDQYMTGSVEKDISANDLWTINDASQYTVQLYTSKLVNDRLTLVFAVTKLVDSPSVQPFTLKTPYRPIGVCAINNDKGLNGFIRNNGTTNLGNLLTTGTYTYCYCDFQII